MDPHVVGDLVSGEADDVDRMLHVVRAQVMRDIDEWRTTTANIPSADFHRHWIGPANRAYQRSLGELSTLSRNVVGILDDAQTELTRAIASRIGHV